MLLCLIPLTGIHAAKNKPPLHHVTAEACGQCHKAIYDQWQGSIHAQSTALRDPIHGAFYKKLMGDPTQEGLTQPKTGKYPVCLQCHAPNAARDGKTKLDSLPAYTEGVNCVVCHTMQAYKGVMAPEGGKPLRLGVQAYEFADEALQGPNGAYHGTEPAVSPGAGNTEPVSNAFSHGEANQGVFKSSNACLGCHDQRNNTHGIPVCMTGPEVTNSGNTITCQSCHMPVNNGFADHTMGGGHVKSMVERGVAVQVNGEQTTQGIQVTVTLHNPLPHNFPTGAPFRNIYLKLTALDASGQTAWQNYQTSPFAENDPGVLMLKLGDADGKPVPPPQATRILSDTRLKPNESRILSYAIPTETAAKVVRIRAELFYQLLWPNLIHQLGDKIPANLTTPMPVTRVETTIP
jgi:hypothetical protein